MEPFEFLSEQEVKHGHAGLGAGTQFSATSDNSKVETEKTRGKLYAR